MYNLASKVLGAMLDPFLLALLLALGSLFLWKKRRLAFRLLAASVLTTLALSMPWASGWLTLSLERQFPDVDSSQVAPAQAVVVLGGTIHMPSREHHASGLIESSDRLLRAYRLYRAGKAPLIVCSGGNNPLGVRAEEPESVAMSQLLEEWGAPASAVEVETGSINTRENALDSYGLLAPRGIRRIILVTSALHMPRAAVAFRKAGFDVIPAPADFVTGWGEPGPLDRALPGLKNMEGSVRALHEWLGLWAYRLRGWA